jgi:hypothetical protein
MEVPMRIEEFLSSHGLTMNPFANAEEAQGDQVLMKLLQQKHFHFGHPQWQKFYGDPPGNQTSVVFGLKGSGKTAMRLALDSALDAYNNGDGESKVLLINYDDFNPYLDAWKSNTDKALLEERAFTERLFNKPAREATLGEDWSLPNHIDAIIAEAVIGLADMLREAPKSPSTWPLQTKHDTMLLAAVYLPRAATEYKSILQDIHQQLFGGSARFGQSVGRTATAVATLGFASMLRGSFVANLARKIGKAVEVVERDLPDLQDALSMIPSSYLKHEPLIRRLVDRNDMSSRFDLLRKLVNIAHLCGYSRVVVVMDKIDEPSMIHGDYEHMAEFIKPLWNNKLLQTSGVQFKMLLPAQLYRTVRKAQGDLLNQARLDKANMIYPFTWSGKHLHEMLAERCSACLGNGETDQFDLKNLFADEVTREEIIEQLDKMKIPRYSSKLMNMAIVTACENILAQELNGQKPYISGKVFYKCCTELETEMRNDIQDLLEFE